MTNPTVALRNTSAERGTPRPFLATLLHAAYCERGGSCGCVVERYETLRRESNTGEELRQSGRRHRPSSLWILPGDKVSGLHPCIIYVPGVDTALRDGILAVHEENSESPDSPAADGGSQVEKQPGPSGRRAKAAPAD